MTEGSWIDYITNDVGVRATLPHGLPLDGLVFAGLKFEPGSILSVELYTKSMPLGAPVRWVERGEEFLSITFRMGVVAASIKMQELDEMQLVRVVLKADQFTLTVEDSPEAPSVQIDAKTFYIEAILKPMQCAQLRP